MSVRTKRCNIGCAGHLGKFSSCQTEALYEISLDGGDDATGSTEAYGHFTLILLDSSLAVEIISDERTVIVPAGAYIVESTEQGFVYAHEYETESDARADFRACEDEYSAWFDSEGGEL